MKQTLFMLGLLAVSLPWAILNPFVGLMVYYGLELLRPQFLWRQTLQLDWRFSLMVGVATILGFAINGFGRSEASRRWPIEKILLLVLAVAVMLSYVNAVDRGAAEQRFTEYCKVFLMFFVACNLLDSRNRLRVLTLVIVLAMGWVAIDFNQRYILMHQTQVAAAGFDGQDNNGLAALMVMGIPFCVFAFNHETRWYLKWPPVLLVLLMMHVVLFSMSRGGMLGLIVIAPLMFLRMKRRLLGVLLLIVMAAAGLRLAGPEVRARFFSIEQYEADASAQGRLAAWKVAGDMVKDYPLLGVGPRCYRHVAGRYNPELDNRSVHSQVLETATEMGIPAAAAYVGMMGLALVHLQRLRRQHKQDPFVFNLAGSLQTSLIGFLAVGTFLSLGTVELTYITLAMVVGLRNILAEQAAPQLSTKPVPVVAPPGGLKPALT